WEYLDTCYNWEDLDNGSNLNDLWSQVALVWQVDCSPGSVALPPTSLRSPLAMEEEAASSLSTLLQTLLLSVERAIERVPLDELSFPCPDCQEVLMTSCACACQVLPLVVEKRDSSIQTSPMFEYAGSIPHIDSDEESVASHDGQGDIQETARQQVRY
ncbi:unnamed protein product, partial [Timema podura]|nr:unnamed protein product [Timema podura]